MNLVALVFAQPGADHSLVELDHMHVKDSMVLSQISDLIEQSCPGHTRFTVTLKAYPADRRLYVVTYLKHYLQLD